MYSFGVVLWELWTGREPYDGLNYHALLHQITTSKGLVRPPMPNSPEWEHPPLPELVPGYMGLIESCWEENPSKRPTSVPCLSLSAAHASCSVLPHCDLPAASRVQTACQLSWCQIVAEPIKGCSSCMHSAKLADVLCMCTCQMC